MRALHVSIASLIVVLASSGIAQDEPEKPTPQQEYQAIDARYQTEMKAYQKAVEAFAESEDYKRAREEQDVEKLREFHKMTPKPPSAEPYAQEMLVCAEKYAGTEEAVPFLCWVALAPNCRDQTGAAVRAITTSHAGSPQMLPFVMKLPELRVSMSRGGLPVLLEKIAQANNNALVKAYCYYGCLDLLGAKPIQEQKHTDYLNEHERLTGLVANYGDGLEFHSKIKVPGHSSMDPTVGQPAPEFGGVKLDSWGFDKRHFEGKILVACFWNEQFPGGAEQLAYIDELSKRWKGAPMVFVGFNTNPEREIAERFVKEHKIEWPMIYGGVWGRFAEMPSNWDIREYPTTIVIDDAGILRAMVSGPVSLDDDLDRCLQDLENRKAQRDEAGEEEGDAGSDKKEG